MRIAIYNRWLHIRGGGERHSLALAAVLAQRHSVTLLTHQPVDLAALGSFFQLDLSALAVELVPASRSGQPVAERSATFDGFIGASHTEIVAAQARHNALLVFFPSPFDQLPPSHAVLSGWYPAEEGPHGSFRWSEPQATIKLTPQPHKQILTIGLAAPKPRTVVTLRSGDVERSYLIEPRPQWFRFDLPVHTAEVELIAPSHQPAGDQRSLGLALYGLSMARSFWRTTGRWQAAPDELADEPLLTPAVLDRYPLLLANSQFTQRWITTRWDRSSSVLYPPIAIDHAAPRAKQPMILSVGRFFPGGHAKQHALLITAFQQLQAAQAHGWRLVLAGGLDQAAPSHQAYFASLQAMLGDAPITLLPNATPAELAALYGEASLYWHASGFGIDLAQQPEAVEHFGITVVEALAAGAVPIVYGAGGPAEIVTNGATGRHWHTPAELVAITQALIADPVARDQLAQAGTAHAQTYNLATFTDRVWQLFGDWEN